MNGAKWVEPGFDPLSNGPYERSLLVSLELCHFVVVCLVFCKCFHVNLSTLP